MRWWSSFLFLHDKKSVNFLNDQQKNNPAKLSFKSVRCWKEIREENITTGYVAHSMVLTTGYVVHSMVLTTGYVAHSMVLTTGYVAHSMVRQQHVNMGFQIYEK